MKVRRIIAIVLAAIIGTMSVISGSSVLLGLRVVDYTALNWLVVYNVTLGILSIITGFVIWKKLKFSINLIITILLLHLFVLSYLYFFSETVATKSIKAMAFRVSIWLLIFILVWIKKGNSIKINKS